ncbi:spore germination protein (amino acid permease) [Bacillus cereus MSX-A1]|uniref:GerAB/ArcD/ProY family transporter n=1 Tax=Bacillus cereus TaxID=1396 RepID=UPI0002797490|nr:endospore germination permease [Bacillus cereus]EJQ98117.1 spore germination protein (amino acid permease) [Bacillus cereus MSX-A1]MDR4293472.1 GerAB/ArcD/ProY family transporter [Bacillus cereus]
MNKHEQDYITLLEYILCIHTVQIASGILIMPSSIAIIAGTDGWIAVIFGWFLTNIIGMMIVYTMQQHKNLSFYQIIENYFGGFLGKLIIGSYAIYFAIVGFNTLLRAIDIIRVWIFPTMLPHKIVILFLLPLLVLVRHGVPAIVRYQEVVFFLTMLLPLLLLFALKNSFHLSYIFPLIKEGLRPILLATKETITPYAGLETVYFLYPFLRNKEKAMQGVLIANTCTMCVFIYITLLCYVYFSPDGIKHLIWPVFHLLKGIHFNFLERFEIVYIAYYLLMFSTTVFPYLYFSAAAIKKNFSVLNLYYVLLFLVGSITLIMYYITFNLYQLLSIYKFVDRLNITFFVMIPTLLFVYMVCWRWWERRE